MEDDELKFGPNGGLIFSMEFLMENTEWLEVGCHPSPPQAHRMFCRCCLFMKKLFPRKLRHTGSFSEFRLIYFELTCKECYC
jgi:hypothetical protein